MVKIEESGKQTELVGNIKVDKAREIAPVDDRLFGCFVEHVGRAVYGGIYEPTHPLADENGFRTDVIAAVREMGVSCVRYPGGNFVSGYHWKDGIGKAESRPVRLNLAWRELEPNRVGTDEFMKWASLAGVEPIMAVNMGNGSAEEAAQLVEYVNFPRGTAWSDARIQNGHEAPYGVRDWCIGNEMDGSYQLGALPAEDYARKAAEAVKQMRRVDGEIRCIMAGSSSPWSPTFPAWDRAVLNATYDCADFLSLHAYYTYKDYGEDKARALREFLASPVSFRQYIERVRAICDEAKAEKRGGRDIMLAMDEWNVWHNVAASERHETPWQVGEALVENSYDLADALVVSGIFTVLLNECDRVKIACMAQLVNVIAPIMTEAGGRLLKQTTFYPFRLFSKCRGMKALALEEETAGYACDYGIAPYLYGAVCSDGEKYIGYFVNVADEGYDFGISFAEDVAVTCVTEFSGGIHERNTFSRPEAVVPRENRTVQEARREHAFRFAPYSLTVVEWKASKRN